MIYTKSWDIEGSLMECEWDMSGIQLVELFYCMRLSGSWIEFEDLLFFKTVLFHSCVKLPEGSVLLVPTHSLEWQIAERVGDFSSQKEHQNDFLSWEWRVGALRRKCLGTEQMLAGRILKIWNYASGSEEGSFQHHK